MTRPSRFEGRSAARSPTRRPGSTSRRTPAPTHRTWWSSCSTTPGFAQFGCYGSDIDTPNIDALAAGGLQFTNFHVTPLCSPTRASLLTGRVAARRRHAVGVELPHRLPAPARPHLEPRRHRRRGAAATRATPRSAVGKWHLAPMEQCSAAGPFDQWPLGRGLRPLLRVPRGRDRPVPPRARLRQPPDRPAGAARGRLPPQRGPRRPGCCGWSSDSKGVRPDRPFFAYLAVRRHPRAAPGAAPTTSRSTAARFDEGWDVVRQRWFERQLELGRHPAPAPSSRRATPASSRGTTCPRTSSGSRPPAGGVRRVPRPHRRPDRPARRRAPRRSASSTTPCFVVLADNGACQEGGPFGVMHEMKFFNGILETPDEAIDRIDDIGGPHSHTNYPWGWAQCGNTPFKWYKQNTHEGGVHVPMIVHWPAGIAADQRGHERDQFVNVSDIAPTIYELLGVTPPDVYRGVEQLPVTGHSFASARSPTRPRRRPNTLQYFEMAGSRALVAGEWKAVCKHQPGRRLRHRAVGAVPPRRRLRPSATTSPREQPDKLAELVELWWQRGRAPRRAARSTTAASSCSAPGSATDSPHPADRRYVYRPPMSPMPGQASAAIGGRSFDLTARVTARAGRRRACSTPPAPRTPASSVFVQDDRLVVDYNAFDDHTVVESDVDGARRRRRRSSPSSGAATASPGTRRARGRRRRRPARPTCRCSCG